MKIKLKDFYDYRPRNIMVAENGILLQCECDFYVDEIYYYVVDKKNNRKIRYKYLDAAVDMFNKLVEDES